ncbi:ClbS/DfsB family four-helix bundle protein [Agromyces mediolanus]|uniref:ClbS/DfsB family four-helix bundle protein n=1 Tax=Agromyces mediolanus TaxID=41986 RepID=UPI0038335F73
MPTPETPIALQAAAMRGFSTLEAAVDAIPAAERDAPFTANGGRDRDLQDVLNHVHAWHELLLGWLSAIERGETPAYPAEGHGWNELEALNTELRDRTRTRGGAERAFARLQGSHAVALARVGALDRDVLFDPARFDWLGGPLAEPVHECLRGHYEWAVQAIGAAR